MASRAIHVHRAHHCKFAPIEELVGVADIKAIAQADPGGGQPTEIPLNGLAFTDADGETHVYVLADEERQIVIRQLTGGIVLPD